MYTSCPHCGTVHPLHASELGQGRGFVQCGQCRQEFNALTRLADERPAKESRTQYAPLRGELPVLGDPKALAAEMELLGRQAGEPPPGGRGRRWPWIALLVLLIPVTATNLAWTFREEVLEWPAARALALRHGLPGEEAPEAFRDPMLIHLVSRDFHTHPSQAGVLVLSAMFINLASHSQPYPALSITLLDADNRPLANREFEPREYLLAGVDHLTHMSPGVRVPLLLEFVDPGEQAVGFELEFQ